LFGASNMDQEKKTIEEIGEFGFIRSIMEKCLYSPESVIQGIGDDCAVIGPYGPYEGKVLLITTDLLIEDIHFLMGKITPRELGAKAVAVNLSDIAAMGGTARHIFVSLAMPRGMAMDTMEEVYAGMKDLCRRYGVNLLGGDTSSSPRGLFINVTVMGEAAEEEVLYRKGASPGDLIYVTGTLGDAAAGLKLLKGELPAPGDLRDVLVAAHNRPEPRLEAGRLVAQSRLASAMIDISDGLLADLHHICEESKVGAQILQERVPVSRELSSLCKANDLNAFHMALSGGEDYQLLFTVPKKNAESIERQIKQQGHPPFRIGKITAEEGVRLVSPHGTDGEITQRGFDHFPPPAR